MKKTWQAPQLVILVRSTLEEKVLVACKWLFGSTPEYIWTDCWYDPTTTCDALAPS